MMYSTRTKLIAAAVAIVLIFVLLVLAALKSNTVAPAPKAPNTTAPADAIAVATRNITAREDSVGADQSSPISWTNAITTITTPDWLAKLQPDPNGSTAGGLGEDNVAHNQGFLVRASVSNCRWNLEASEPTTSAGIIFCDLSDTTISQAGGQQVPDLSLPSGWTHTGTQIAPTIGLIKQNGVWLVNDDSTGE